MPSPADSQPKEPTRAPFEVDFHDATGRVGRDRVLWLSDQCQRVGEVLKLTGSCRVRVVDDAEIAATHEEFLGVAGTTDVITFDLREGEPHDCMVVFGEKLMLSGMNPGPHPIDADVSVCLDEAIRQAGRRGYSFDRELLLYVVHALLHCLGLDDHDEAQAAAMHGLEDQVLGAIGVGPVYGAPPRGGVDSAG